VRISRLNRYYEPALRLCRLLLEGSGVKADLGDVLAPAFFVPMETVFERAVANALQGRDGPDAHHGAAFSDRFRHIAGSPALTISFKPDVLLGPRDDPWSVLDAKYLDPIRMHRGQPVFSNPNLYQMVTYCVALRCPGVLVYPRVSEDVDVTYEMAGAAVTLRTVDLAMPSSRACGDSLRTSHASCPSGEPGSGSARRPASTRGNRSPGKAGALRREPPKRLSYGPLTSGPGAT